MQPDTSALSTICAVAVTSSTPLGEWTDEGIDSHSFWWNLIDLYAVGVYVLACAIDMNDEPLLDRVAGGGSAGSPQAPLHAGIKQGNDLRIMKFGTLRSSIRFMF
jgi:hypothetical protein